MLRSPSSATANEQVSVDSEYEALLNSYRTLVLPIMEHNLSSYYNCNNHREHRENKNR